MINTEEREEEEVKEQEEAVVQVEEEEEGGRKKKIITQSETSSSDLQETFFKHFEGLSMSPHGPKTFRNGALKKEKKRNWE